MHGAIDSLVGRSTQLMKRVKAEPEYTLIGGILKLDMMARTIGQQLNTKVNVPPKDMVQFVSAYGAAILGQWRLERLASA
jgi:activator of 2-hydroxyglutaryl-CoA dehydratase